MEGKSESHKTEVILLQTSCRKVDSIHISINNHPLQQTDTHKFLGLKIQQNLSWKSHTDEISKKVYKRMGFSVSTKQGYARKLPSAYV